MALREIENHRPIPNTIVAMANAAKVPAGIARYTENGFSAKFRLESTPYPVTQPKNREPQFSRIIKNAIHV
jgi:hypothetical protein